MLNILFISLIGYKKPTEPTEPPPPPILDEPTLRLELDDAHCTEVWIKFTNAKLKTPNTLILKQYNPNDDSLIHTINLITQDTLLHIDSLLPNKTYRYKAEAIANNKVYTTNELIVQTMDTTSHNFTFEMFTFGEEIGSSVLFDVAIINENNIWTVGDIWIKSDTSATGYIKYNAVHWNGTEWKLHRIMFYTICGQYNRTPYPAKAIFVFNENDIWIAMDGDQIARMNGTVQVSVECLPYSFVINKIWGTSSNNLYVVGNSGNILHYNGMRWRRIESHTTLNINDIWGDYNPKTNEWEILAVGGNILAGYENCVIQIHSNNSTKRLNTEGAEWPLRSTWFEAGGNYYIAGSGIYQKHILNDNIWKNDIFSITTYSTNRIRGIEINDIAATGGAGELLHFNGYSWKSFIDEVGIPGNYYSTDINGNTIISVGQSSNQAVITIGKR